jgi:ABC-type Fe3+ transport system substrate-binding protein
MLISRKAQAAATPLLTAFKQLFPKVEINITAELSKYADSKIDRSYIEGEPFIDYAMLQTVHDFPRWKTEGKLLEYKPPHFEDVNHTIKDKDGAYVPVGFSKSNLNVADAVFLILFQINSAHSTMIQKRFRPTKSPHLTLMFSIRSGRIRWP